MALRRERFDAARVAIELLAGVTISVSVTLFVDTFRLLSTFVANLNPIESIAVAADWQWHGDCK